MKIVQCIFWGLFISLSTGCSPLILPNSYHTPDFEEKGDTQVEICTSTSGFDLNLAYSPFNHVGFVANYNNYTKSSRYTTDSKKSTSVYHLGVGYHYPKKMVQFGLYGILGLHKMNKSDTYSFTKVHSTHIQLQPHVNLKAGIFDLYYGYRLSLILVSDFQTNSQSMINPHHIIRHEPFAGLKIGAKNLKINLQMGLSLNEDSFINTEYRSERHISPGEDYIQSSIGLSYRFNPIKKRFSIRK